MLRNTENPEKRLKSIIADRYRLDAILGTGTVGVVYLGTDLQTQSQVAIKIMRKSVAKSPDVVARFLREPRAASAIRHPNIVSIFDASQLPDGAPYFAMEYLEGETLEAIVRRSAFSIEDAVNIARQVLDALESAHRAGIVHRDLKSSNVMLALDSSGASRVKILDFGLIKKLSPDVQSVVTRAGVAMGTPYCMSPEQVRADPVDARADIWAVGVLLYELLVQKPPFDSHEMFELLRDIVHTSAVPPSIYRDEIPLWLDRVVLRALEKNPADRWQTAEAMNAALRDQTA